MSKRKILERRFLEAKIREAQGRIGHISAAEQAEMLASVTAECEGGPFERTGDMIKATLNSKDPLRGIIAPFLKKLLEQMGEEG